MYELTEVGLHLLSTAADLRMEEDLGAQEALVADVDVELLLGDGVDAGVLFDPLGTVCVVFAELLDEVGTNVAEPFLKHNNKIVYFRVREFLKHSCERQPAVTSSGQTTCVFCTCMWFLKHQIRLLGVKTQERLSP